MNAEPMQQQNTSEYLKTSEAAAAANVSTDTIGRLIKRGVLAGIRIGRSFRIPRAALETYLKRGN